MAKKKKKKYQSVHKAIKAKLREQSLAVNGYQRTTEQTHKSKKAYTRKNQKPPEDED